MSCSGAKWDEFFTQKTFSKVFFLTNRGEIYKRTGCGSPDHCSWCEGYAALKVAVQACLVPR